MKAIKGIDGRAQLLDVPRPTGEGVLVRIASSSICGSDLHLLELGFLEDRVIGHEFAGYTPDGTAVAVEPTISCGHCPACGAGNNMHCAAGLHLLGVMSDGGMAEYVMAPARNLVELPTGLALPDACLIEPLAVALHGLDRAGVRPGEQVLVIGAGPVGLAVAAGLQGRQIPCSVAARHPHQQQAAQRLGASLELADSYDVVIDAVGTTDSLQQAVRTVRPMGRIGLVGSLWQPATLDAQFCLKEAELIAAHTYGCKAPNRNFEEAGRLLQRTPAIAECLISHRFPLDAAEDAFAAAAARRAGAIKVVFDVC